MWGQVRVKSVVFKVLGGPRDKLRAAPQGWGLSEGLGYRIIGFKACSVLCHGVEGLFWYQRVPIRPHLRV